MDEKYIEKIYAKFGEEVLGSFDKFSELISTDEKYQRKIYDNLGGEEVFGGYPEYSTLISRRSEGEVAESLNDMWNSPKEGSDMMNIDAAPVKKKKSLRICFWKVVYRGSPLSQLRHLRPPLLIKKLSVRSFLKGLDVLRCRNFAMTIGSRDGMMPLMRLERMPLNQRTSSTMLVTVG
jgi:hypothetical protein